VMAMPTIHVPAEENLGDLIETRVYIVHPILVVAVAFLATTVVRTLSRHEEVIRVRSLEVVETWLHGIVKDEREARERIECQLGLVQEELESLRRSRLP
ncbi:hypothetical protein Tco_1061171, partial [Tanacetum coccineum]